ncbi:MAG: methyl-accepting chemotaxis protein [Spirochaetota bacterium]
MGTRSFGFVRGIGGRITVMTVAIALLALGAVTVISVVQSSGALTEAQTAQLRAVRDVKNSQVASYFSERRDELNVLSDTIATIEHQAFTQLEGLHLAKKEAVERYFRTTPEAYDERADREIGAQLTELVGSRAGMGETGETYLSEYDGGTYTLRSDIPITGDGDLVHGTDVTDITPEYVKLAHRGESGYDLFTDSAGTLIMAVYTPIEYGEGNVALVTKKNLEESLTVTLDGSQQDYLARYTERLGYYDLFLVHPDGEIFYTVARESDYGTNIIRGEYSDSSLNEAVTEAITTEDFGFGDFSPYEPSGGQPASFVADPIMRDGEIEFLVALQMPLEEINAIMSERTGMGETGETYLVGPDHLMRSDSYLDQKHHSVAASFANPETGSVDTVAVERALAGKTDARAIIDYTGGEVLSAYSPVEVYDTRWALLAEIDEAEIMAPVQQLVWFVIGGALVVLLLAIAGAILFSRSISKPITTIAAGSDRLAIGDIRLTGVKETEIERINARSDELGMIGRSFTDLIEYQREKSDVAREIASKNLEVRVSAASEQDVLGNAFRDMVEALNDLLGQTQDSVDQVSAGASQVSQASQELSQGATEQASSLEEVSSSVTEINSQSRQNADHAAEASKLAQEAQQNAEEGNTKMDELRNLINTIAGSSEETKKVVKVIDDIAFQINLLALNANVEAARAGKYGRGFAVVAEEVRNLASRSTEAVQETTGIVEESVRNMEAGTQAGELTAQQLDAIVTGARRVTEYLDDIAAASREQADAISQVTEGLDQIDQVTQANTASSEESASAAEELASQADQLRALVAEYRIAHRTEQSPLRIEQTTASHGGHSGNGAGDAPDTGGTARREEPARLSGRAHKPEHADARS